jgi:hypothetical protein
MMMSNQATLEPVSVSLVAQSTSIQVQKAKKGQKSTKIRADKICHSLKKANTATHDSPFDLANRPTVFIFVIAFTLESFHIRIMKHLPVRRKLGPASRITITKDSTTAAKCGPAWPVVWGERGKPPTGFGVRFI